jgi:hypothetical protein
MSTTAANTLMLPDSFSLLDLMVARLNAGGGSRPTNPKANAPMLRRAAAQDNSADHAALMTRCH